MINLPVEDLLSTRDLIKAAIAGELGYHDCVIEPDKVELYIYDTNGRDHKLSSFEGKRPEEVLQHVLEALDINVISND